MKKFTQKLTLFLLSVIVLIAVPSAMTVQAAQKEMSITLRIEGIEKNLFYGTVNVPYTDSLTLQKALSYIDSKEKGITITGIDSNYITGINDESAGRFGGWDGWLFTVNGKAANVGIDGLKLSDGDSVILYYGDPFGVGMQYPKADTSDIKDGVIRFTSSDTTYDADNNATVKINPVAGATVIWKSGNTTAKYVTDKNGKITIKKDQLTAGTHRVQISKTGTSGIPLVLRYAPDYAITIASNGSTSKAGSTAGTNTSVSGDTDSNVPKTGDNGDVAVVTFILAAASLMGAILIRNKAAYEK